MKTKLFLLLVLFLVTIKTSMAFQEKQDHKVLFEKAKYTMETKADLKEAITLFESLIKTYPNEKEYAAKAQFHIGLCYEKLGLKEAQKAYRAVVNNYPGQKNEVALAKERLSLLILLAEKVLKTPLTPKFTKIKIPTELSWNVKLSPDGKDLALVSDKKLWRMPLSGNLGQDFPGTPVQLNTEDFEVEWNGLSWSGDGKWIAFNEHPYTYDSLISQSIYVVPSSGGIPKKVIESYRDSRVVNYRISLSLDGKELAFSLVENDKQHIHTIPVEGGDPKQLTNMEAREPVFSPDGKMIAFVADRGIGRGAGDLGLWVIPTQGGNPQLVANAGKASSPVWSPDGSMIAFLDYTRGQQIFIVQINKTIHAIGNPISIDAPEGTSEVRLLAGWTPDNKIGTLLVRGQGSALYTLPVKGGQAAMILHNTDAYQPRWSKDGKQIFYITQNKEVDKTFTWGYLSSVEASGGNGKPLHKNQDEKTPRLYTFQGGNRISPDGKMIISGAWTPEDISTDFAFPKARIWKLAIDGSESTKITHTQGPYLDASPCWSPDGTKIAFIRVQLNKIKTNNNPMGDSDIYVIDSSGEDPELLASNLGKVISSLVWSPDGKMIAYFSKEKESPATSYMNVINLEGRKTRIVGEVPSVNVLSELAWSPDSKRIAFNDNESNEIKVMSLSDGSMDDIRTGLKNVDIFQLDWSPDGERFVFGGWSEFDTEFWILEDFLPEIKSKQ